MGDASTVDILLKTSGDTSGVDKVNAALGIVERSEKQLAAARAQFLSATEAEVAEVNRLVEASKRTAEAQKTVTQETNLQTDAMKRLEEAAQRTQKFFTPAAINPWVTASAGAKVNLDNLHVSQEKAAGSSRNMGNALLQASRGLQDMQYGLAGAVNNLEGIASSLGLGAGVAGVVTVLAVAVQTLGPAVVEWLKSLDTEGKKLEDLKASLERAAKAIKGEFSANTENAKRISDAFSDALKKEGDALAANDRALESNVKLIKQRADLQKTENQRRLESDIADIQSQGMDPEQERAAIATRKREELDANKKLAEDAASVGISGESEKVVNQQKRRDELKQQEQTLKEEKRAAAEYAQLKQEQAGIEQKKRKEDSNATRVEAELGFLPDAFKESQAQAQAKLDANEARQKELLQKAPEGRMRGVNEVQAELDQVTPQAKAAEDQAAKDLEALNAKVREETLAQEFRDKQYQRDLDKIAREQTPGVYDQGNLKAPPAGLPGSALPLPPPAAPGTMLPAPPPGFGPGELNPPRVPTSAPGPTFGPQPNEPEAKGGEIKGGDKIVTSNDKANAAMMRIADAVEKSNDALLKRMSALEAKFRNQGVMA